MDGNDTDIVVCREPHLMGENLLGSRCCLLISHSDLVPQAQARCFALFLSFFVILACYSLPVGVSGSVIMLFP